MPLQGLPNRLLLMILEVIIDALGQLFNLDIDELIISIVKVTHLDLWPREGSLMNDQVHNERWNFLYVYGILVTNLLEFPNQKVIARDTKDPASLIHQELGARDTSDLVLNSLIVELVESECERFRCMKL